MSGLAYRKASARSALTPGELEGKTNGELYLSPSMKQQGDYIPAYKGQSRRLPMTDAFNSEAAQLHDAELDLRNNAKFDRVFGNGLFEDGAGSPTASKAAPGHVKMNNLFEDPARQPDQRFPRNSEREERPLPLSNSLVARRNGSAGPNALNQQVQGTVVQAFDEDETAMPVVSRARAVPAVTQGSTRDRSTATWEGQVKQMIASGRREEAVKLPAPSSGMVRCYVKRVKNLFGTHCTFQMHLDNGDVFLLAARRRKKSKVSSYILSLDLEDIKRDNDNCLAKVKANFVGTEYIMWGRSEDKSMKKGYGREELCINFKQTALSTKGGPRAMYVVLPLPELEWSPSDPSGHDSLSNSLEMAKRRELPPYLEKKMAMLSTKPPEWDENLKAFTLDFHGRVKEASVKNFQLVHWDHNTDQKGSDLMLQFGKSGDDMYALDFAYPLTIEMAFAIALASIDTKLCYTL